MQIGILGLAYPNTALTTASKNVTGLAFRDGAATANELIPHLRRTGAVLVVILSHLGLTCRQAIG